ncbi:putative small secreted protein [Kerstersia gyiorum]|nr:putative small secreted protein [Kerstersia gyiorum]MCP1671323.1 putative small secreted protein [Kerstersia gyiorum]MCP1679022.1 putative small secreted protein [Kerstersia gyiorum]MCP1709080.1 putative small secreted protein [Kerstersia gyiorum]MCP1714121.1 putative small secreted protein [Kerstersia gyiorum]
MIFVRHFPTGRRQGFRISGLKPWIVHAAAQQIQAEHDTGSTSAPRVQSYRPVSAGEYRQTSARPPCNHPPERAKHDKAQNAKRGTFVTVSSKQWQECQLLLFWRSTPATRRTLRRMLMNQALPAWAAISSSILILIFHGGCMNKKALILAIAMLATTLAGCNTVDGIGKDIERGGEKIQEQAQ